MVIGLSETTGKKCRALKSRRLWGEGNDFPKNNRAGEASFVGRSYMYISVNLKVVSMNELYTYRDRLREHYMKEA